jgi:hypothetical protein
MKTFTLINPPHFYQIEIPDEISDQADQKLWESIVRFLYKVGDFYACFKEVGSIWETLYTYHSIQGYAHTLYYTIVCTHRCRVSDDWELYAHGPEYHTGSDDIQYSDDCEDGDDSNDICVGKRCRYYEARYMNLGKKILCRTLQYRPSDVDFARFTLADTECCCTLIDTVRKEDRG